MAVVSDVPGWSQVSPRRVHLGAAALLVTLTCAPAAAQVTLSFRGVALAQHPSLLFDGMRNGTCRRDELTNLTRLNVPLGAVNPIIPGCPLEVLSFAVGRRPFIVTTALLADFITGPLVGLYAKRFIVMMGPPDPLDITVWLGADDDYDPAEAESMLDDAGVVLKQGRTGLRPNVTTVDRSADAIASARMALGCPGASAIQEAGDYSAGRLNVYITEFEFPESDLGVHCVGPAWNMIFVRWYAFGATVAHEIGHALGLEHTDESPGFNDENLMYSLVSEVRNVSLGQAYRVQVSSASWLNRDAVAGSRPLVKACQLDPLVPGVCPMLRLGMLVFP